MALGSKAREIITYIEQHPGIAWSELRKQRGESACAYAARLAKQGHLFRDPHKRFWPMDEDIEFSEGVLGDVFDVLDEEDEKR